MSDTGGAVDVVRERLAEREHALGRRIVGLSPRHRCLDLLGELTRDREITRVEIADREVYDPLAASQHSANLARGPESPRLGQLVSHDRKRSVERALVTKVERAIF